MLFHNFSRRCTRNSDKHNYICSLNQYISSSSHVFVETNHQAGHKKEIKYTVMLRIEILILDISIV